MKEIFDITTQKIFTKNIYQAECRPDTCSQMTATEQWIFLCAAHKTPKECPAIDYTRYTRKYLTLEFQVANAP